MSTVRLSLPTRVASKYCCQDLYRYRVSSSDDATQKVTRPWQASRFPRSVRPTDAAPWFVLVCYSRPCYLASSMPRWIFYLVNNCALYGMVWLIIVFGGRSQDIPYNGTAPKLFTVLFSKNEASRNLPLSYLSVKRWISGIFFSKTLGKTTTRINDPVWRVRFQKSSGSKIYRHFRSIWWPYNGNDTPRSNPPARTKG